MPQTLLGERSSKPPAGFEEAASQQVVDGGED